MHSLTLPVQFFSKYLNVLRLTNALFSYTAEITIKNECNQKNRITEKEVILLFTPQIGNLYLRNRK